jgi:hypothetical protein
LGVSNFFGFSELIIEGVIVPLTCLILDPFGPVRVSRGRRGYTTQFTIITRPSPISFVAPPPQPEVSGEMDQSYIIIIIF